MKIPSIDDTTTLLIGRETELRRLDSWLNAAVTDGSALCVVGDAGMGKTALLDVATERAARAGMQVLHAAGRRSGDQAGLGVLGALGEVLEPLRDRIERASGPDTAALTIALGLRDGPARTDLQVFAATLLLLRRVARDQPVAVIVDDAQWIDGPSAMALNFVARRVAGSPLGVLMSTRPGHPETIGRRSIPNLELTPLDDRTASRLLGIRFPDLSAGARRRIIKDAAGNPLALVELPVALTPAQRSGQAELMPILASGGRLVAMFADRISGLSAPGREALLLAALRQGESTVHELGSAGWIAPDTPDAVAGLHEAERAGLVINDQRRARLSFCHPLVGSAVVEMSSEPELRRAHRILAGAAAAGSPHQVWHRAQASVAPDEGLAEELESVAYFGLRQGDGRLAVRALARAGELSPGSAERARRLATAAYLGADVTGELGRVSSLLADAATARVTRRDSHGRPDAPRTSLSVATAQAYLVLNRDGDIAAAHRLLVDAVSIAAPLIDTIDDPVVAGDLGETLHTLMLVCFFGGSADLWSPFYAAVEEIGRRAPRVLALCADTFGDPVHRAAPALPRLDAHLAGMHREVDPTTVVRSAMASFYVDRLAQCREALARVVVDGRAGGAVASAIDAVIELGFDAFGTGDWDEAARRFAEGAELSTRHGYRLLAWPARFGQALLAAAQGDYATVDTITTEMIAFAQPRSAHQVAIYAHHAQGLAALGRGDPGTALEQVAQISTPGELAPSTAHALWVMLDTVEAAVAVGRNDEARAHVAAMREAAVADLSPRYAMVTAAAAALVAGPAEATSLFHTALAIPGADRWSFDWARTQLLFGEHLRRQRNGPRARNHLRAAAEVFSRLGAEPWRSRAASQLRAVGEPLPPRGDNGHRIVLTAQQIRIAQLAAAGLTNKQIADRCRTSHRGVGSMLYRVFRTLNVTSRAALGDALRSHDIRTPG